MTTMCVRTTPRLFNWECLASVWPQLSPQRHGSSYTYLVSCDFPYHAWHFDCILPLTHGGLSSDAIDKCLLLMNSGIEVVDDNACASLVRICGRLASVQPQVEYKDSGRHNIPSIFHQCVSRLPLRGDEDESVEVMKIVVELLEQRT